ncbi:hypothetical protein, partial [Baaleninema sp.]|uniref:baeRF3 domain-containing protein n=1 Tax=Baaleninema sp. TaxID=3101197 RepID=UPI003CFF7F39
MTISIASFIRSELNDLTQISRDPCVSLYMPTHQAGTPAVREDPVRLKNLVSEAAQKLQEQEFPASKIEAILQPAKQPIQPDNRSFWQSQNQGLALFLAEGTSFHYRLPHHFEPLVVVGNRFYLKPLFGLLSNDRDFYVLALSLNGVRLLRGTRHHIEELKFDNAPQGLAEALPYEDPEKQVQIYTGGPATTVRYGQGAATSDRKETIRRYFHQVDDAVREKLGDSKRPLVLAGVDYLLPIYRDANSYPHLLEKGVEGNPDEWKPETLHRQAWQAIAPEFQRQQQQAREQFYELAGTGQATDRLEEIVPAAYSGQVDTLFVAEGVRRWGRFDPQTRHVEMDSSRERNAEDLLELAARQTLLQNGTVYSV